MGRFNSLTGFYLVRTQSEFNSQTPSLDRQYCERTWQKEKNKTKLLLFQTCCSVLTGYSIWLYLKVGDVVTGHAVALSADAAAPGARGGVPTSLVDLVRDHLQVPESRLVLAFGLRQFGLPLIHCLLQVLGGKMIRERERRVMMKVRDNRRRTQLLILWTCIEMKWLWSEIQMADWQQSRVFSFS